MILKACLNGNRQPGSHPCLPLAPHELAQDAARALEAGAQALHVHPRDRNGRETFDPAAVGDAIAAIRAACPGVPLGVSTGAWIERDPEQRLAQVKTWRTLPDFAGVNVSEPGAAELCRALLAMGIGVEAGLWSAEDARAFAALEEAPRCLRVLIEPILTQDLSAALALVDEIGSVLDERQIHLPRLLHGKDATTWALVEQAARLGYSTRIGMEDTLLLPDGRVAQDNAELVRLARQRIEAMRRMA